MREAGQGAVNSGHTEPAGGCNGGVRSRTVASVAERSVLPGQSSQGPHPDHLFFVPDEALARSATFDVPVEVLVRADRFEIDKPHLIIEGVTEQVELSLTAEL